MRKALFAGAVFTLVTAQPAIAITTDMQTTENLQISNAEETELKLNVIVEETNALLAVSNEQLDAYEQALEEAWKASFKDSLRLTAKHTTFKSRLVLQDNQLLYATRSVGSPSGNAYSINLLSSSAITAYELDEYLKDTGMAGLGKAFVKAELQTGVNAVFLVSLAAHESSWGKSRIARDKNNMFGYGAYDASPYQSAIPFSSKEEGIIFVASKLRDNYLSSSGKYYSGSTLAGVNKRYSTDTKWSNKIANTMNQIDEEVLAAQDTTYEVTR